MKYQKIIDLLDNASSQPSKFSTRSWVEIKDESRVTYTGNNIKFKTTMRRSNLCDYANAYILIKGTITITGAGDDAATRWTDERDQEVNRLFGLSFENENDRISWSTYYLPKVEIEDYNVMINGSNFFNHPINNMNKTSKNIRKITTGKRDDYTTGYLLDYCYFKEN